MSAEAIIFDQRIGALRCSLRVRSYSGTYKNEIHAARHHFACVREVQHGNRLAVNGSFDGERYVARTLSEQDSFFLGLGIFAVGSWWMGGLDQDAGYWDVFWPRALQGFSIGFLFVPLSTATLSEVPNTRMANATGIYTLVRQLGGSFGIAVLLFLQTRYQDTAYAGLASSVTLANPSIAYAIQHGVVGPIQLFGIATTNATVLSYDMVFRLCGIVFALAIPLVLLLRPNAPGEKPVHVSLE